MELYEVFMEAFAWINADQAMKLLQVSKGTLRSMRERGDIEYRKDGGAFRYHAPSLCEFLHKKKHKKREVVKNRIKQLAA
jgi:hypothetical protein